jgi:polysaccharide export outer membrane protein
MYGTIFPSGSEAATTGLQTASKNAATSSFSFDELDRVPEGRALIASTTTDYPVTSGDVYTLTFLKAADMVTTTIVVSHDYSVNLGVFGTMMGAGLTFPAFRSLVEKKVTASYPGSAPQLLLLSTGVFQVQVIGEVNKSIIHISWGLERLSSVAERYRTAFSSLRAVQIKFINGEIKSYDLYKAQRDGDLTQDPYLKPGSTVVLKKAERTIKLQGAIHRPDVYQLLPGENLVELIEIYGDGLLTTARPDLVIIERAASSENLQGDIFIIDVSSSKNERLFDNDIVSIPLRSDYLPVVYFEGAIRTANEPANKSSTDRQAIRKGELLSSALKRIAPRILPSADLRRAFIARKNQSDIIPIDLERLLYSYNVKLDIVLEPEDRIVIPSGSLDVFVTGEVTKASWINVTAISRLRATVTPLLTKYSSIRDVSVNGLGGDEKSYDLFKADRYGDLENDPFLKPGDVVTVRKASRQVSIAGEVMRPGTYQLLESEGIQELIQIYGDGLLSTARTDLAILERTATQQNPDGGIAVVDVSSPGFITLFDRDTVRIPARFEYLPVVYYEGAISAEGNESAKQSSMNRRPYRKGDFLSISLRAVAPLIAANADLKRAFIARKGRVDTIPVNLERLLYAYDPKDDIPLEPEDRIVIPVGSLDVFVTGEVTKSSWVNVVAISRLRSVVTPFLTKYSSIRDITIRASDGGERRYDIFRAERDGDLGEDPFLRPGDTVIVNRAERRIEIKGAVYKPGMYQPVRGESLNEIVLRYGDGLLPEARADFTILERVATADQPNGEVRLIDLTGKLSVNLIDGDIMYIPSKSEYLPVIYYEGAISDGTEAAKQTSMDRQPFREGELLSISLRAIALKILPNADLKRAFIARKGIAATIPVNLERILYAYDPKEDLELKAEDRIVIPVGSLDVFVTGEVSRSSWVNVAAISRLSAVVSPLVTKYSSSRDVVVRGEGGDEKSYDLFKALRYGDLDQDPFVKPGDVITVKKVALQVSISGEVKRPGIYQLRTGETLHDLIEVYADGFTERANLERISLLRFLSEGNPLGNRSIITYATSAEMPMRLNDVVTIQVIQDLLPTVFFEGAVQGSASAEELLSSTRVSYQFFPGEKLSQAVQAIRKGFSAVSDLNKAYIIRGDQKTPVDIGNFLYNKDYSQDFELQPNDTIIVPFRQLFVTVSGAVRIPGRYPYIPDRTWEYYLGLAGGFDTERNQWDELKITDVHGNKQSKTRFIQPEDNIEAAANSFLYNFQRVSAVLTTVISIASLVFALMR